MEYAKMKDHSAAFKALVERFAYGRHICNCEQAYYATGGAVWRDGHETHDGLHCKSGCSTNLINAKYEIAERVADLLDKKD